jgi:hypothetical protein
VSDKALKPLYEAFGIEADDIEANRVGRLSARQRDRIRRRIRRLRLAEDGLRLLRTVSIAAGIVIWATQIHSRSRIDSITIVIFIVIFLPMLMPLLFVLFSKWRKAIQNDRMQFEADQADSTVESITGRIKLDIYRSSGVMEIDGEGFFISSPQLLALRNDQYYTLYLLRHRHTWIDYQPTILSITPTDPLEHADEEAAKLKVKAKRGEI